VTRQAIIQFCLEFVRNPNLCYTEHGQHALFCTMLYHNLAGAESMRDSERIPNSL